MAIKASSTSRAKGPRKPGITPAAPKAIPAKAADPKIVESKPADPKPVEAKVTPQPEAAKAPVKPDTVKPDTLLVPPPAAPAAAPRSPLPRWKPPSRHPLPPLTSP